MAFLIPPAVKQRFLRYVISKLDVIDDSAIDLDKFNFAWGRKSVISLPKVPLKARKISCYLPPHLQVVDAYINDFRVTVPANLQGITVDISGVVVKAKTVQGFDEDTAHGKGASAEGSGPEAIPTTEDLAKSFYQDESAEERRQLEAAINSQSQYLQQDPFSGSSMLSDDGYDDPELGTGVGLNFPDFFTNYLHLVQDTLRITIDDIEVHLETEVPPEGWDDDESIKTVLVFHISGVDVEGLTSGGQEEQASSEQEAQTGNGKRKITLKSLSAGLLLDEKSLKPRCHQISASRESLTLNRR
ncbi:Autophagy-related protein [Neofusicoccum parvum]|uniref:Autophagy-related protein 2 n=1 Tax=Botryosphaeria parva (strain UCR-NP2) TaxID=1287680 RepID=R1EWF8_BOTPV|nr:putative autophagy regulatory protein [Neofusicoccum parvum UCRNP2]GME37340.1 Autophagy-related protein [Neofusicoccum parvum]